MSTTKKARLQATGLIEWLVFSELLAMDEDEEGFSYGLFETFIQQFNETFVEIDENLKLKNFEKLSNLGHYLKGSAAALGLVKISNQCERIQNYGHKDDFDNFHVDGVAENSDEFWIKLIEDAVRAAKTDFAESEAALNEYFDTK
jgi:osomolarity two-component system phosphorelay intermediate protein YPD1